MAEYRERYPEIVDFHGYIAYEKHFSERTAEEYSRDTASFADWLLKNTGEEARTLRTCEKSDASRYIRELMSSKRQGVAAVRRTIAALRAFYKFSTKERGWPNNPVLEIALPKAEKRLPTVLSGDELKQVMREIAKAPKDDWRRARNRAMARIFFSSGIRRAELHGLSLQNLQPEARAIKVFGKGRKERVVFYDADTAEVLDLYLGLRPRTADQALWINETGRRLSYKQVGEIISSAGRRAEIKKRVSPHVLRHSFATELRNNGADLMTIKELLGHESVATTQIYTHVSSLHLKKAYDLADITKDLE